MEEKQPRESVPAESAEAANKRAAMKQVLCIVQVWDAGFRESDAPKLLLVVFERTRMEFDRFHALK